MSEYDVIVIGAGISGLTAARLLLARDDNLRVLVLEAKDRVGGRTQSVELNTENGKDTWDLGGQWVGRCQPHIMYLIETLGLQVFPQYIEGRKFCQAGTRDTISAYSSTIPNLSALALFDLHRLMSKADSLAKMVDPYEPNTCPQASKYDSMTLETFLDQTIWTIECKEVIQAAMQTMFGADLSQISVLYFLHYIAAAGSLQNLIEATDYTAQEFRVVGGTQQISVKMAQDIDKTGSAKVQTGQPVASLEQLDDVARVTTQNGRSFTTLKVILAIPPGQIGKIKFSPCLPVDTQEIIKRMPPSNIIKFIITYKEAFWREAGLSGEVVTNGGHSINKRCDKGPLCITYDATSYNGCPALVGFIGAKAAVQWQKQSAESRKSAILKSLSEFFGDNVYSYIDYREKIWDEEPYNNGGPVSCVAPGAMRYLATGLREPFGRVHLAGTESATEWCGFMNGAVQAGERAAIQVLHDLRPQMVTYGDLLKVKQPRRTRSGRKVTLGGKLVRLTVWVGAVYLMVLTARKVYSGLK